MNRDFNEIVKRYSARVNEEIEKFLRKYLEEVEGSIRRKYYEVLIEYVRAGGKRLRPISLIMAYKGLGGKKEDIFLASLSVEFLHNSSLAHDDIMDDSETRRGEPALHVRFRSWSSGPKMVKIGESLGILGGNTLFELGLESLISSGFNEKKVVEASRIYVEAYRKLIEGQVLDLTMEEREIPSEEEYLEMIDLKTGALFNCSLQIGAILAGAGKREREALEEYAVNLARAFQITDDILGVFGEEEVTGKSTVSDIVEGKKTILVINAIKNLSEDEINKFMSILGNKDASIEEINLVKDMMRKTGSLEYAEMKAKEFANRARRLVIESNILVDEEAKTFFIGLCDFVVKRKYEKRKGN